MVIHIHIHIHILMVIHAVEDISPVQEEMVVGVCLIACLIN